MQEINNYKQIPIGKGKDYSNQNIGDFLVLYRTVPPVGIKLLTIRKQM